MHMQCMCKHQISAIQSQCTQNTANTDAVATLKWNKLKANDTG